MTELRINHFKKYINNEWKEYYCEFLLYLNHHFFINQYYDEDNIHNDNMIETWKYKHYWKTISSNKNITITFINKYINELWDWNELSSNQNINIRFIRDNLHKKWNWGKLSSNSAFNMDDILNNPDLNWEYFYVSYNKNINLKFLIEINDKIESSSSIVQDLKYIVDWNTISERININIDELLKYNYLHWNWIECL